MSIAVEISLGNHQTAVAARFSIVFGSVMVLIGYARWPKAWELRG